MDEETTRSDRSPPRVLTPLRPPRKVPLPVSTSARSRRSQSPGARGWVWLCVVLLLCAGLSQRLVLCTSDDGVTHLEFAHAEGACCAHAHAARQHPGGGASHAVDASSDTSHAADASSDTPHNDGDPTCSHVAFAIVLQTAPRRDAVGAPHGPLAHDVPPAPEPPRTPLPAARPRPSNTDPPRPRPFLARHAHTVLLL